MAATLERWALRLARFFSPSLDRLFTAGGGATAALATLSEAETLIDLHQSKDGEWKRELREAAAMYTGYQMDPVMIRESDGRQAYEGLPRQLKERFWELELALEDRGWRRQLALSQYEFSRYGIQQIMLIARLYAVKNPLIRRGIKISSFYVFGRGVDITSEDEAQHKFLTEFGSDGSVIPVRRSPIPSR